jgi:hypothetical protein
MPQDIFVVKFRSTGKRPRSISVRCFSAEEAVSAFEAAKNAVGPDMTSIDLLAEDPRSGALIPYIQWDGTAADVLREAEELELKSTTQIFFYPDDDEP